VLMSNPFYYEVSLRGADASVGTDSVVLLVDGRDLTVEFFGFPMWAVQHFSLDDVKRIEVIRGPGSALYGPNAYAGVVQVFTYEPGEGPEASASVRGGEHGMTEVNGRWTREFGSGRQRGRGEKGPVDRPGPVRRRRSPRATERQDRAF
jgi:outer membrane cobalamin receptor